MLPHIIAYFFFPQKRGKVEIVNTTYEIEHKELATLCSTGVQDYSIALSGKGTRVDTELQSLEIGII